MDAPAVQLSGGGDGIPDWWRLAYFGHALGLAADKSRAGDDADGDGASNLSEYLAGTDPLNPASVFKITNVSISNGVQVVVSCSSVANRAYQLQQRDGLGGASSWASVGVPQTAISNSITLADPNRVSNAPAFYRVHVQ